MTRDYTHDWVKASENRGGVNIHIPQGVLDYLPDDMSDSEQLMVKRYPSRVRNTVMLTLRPIEEIGEEA